jgi:hypothetical protein
MAEADFRFKPFRVFMRDLPSPPNLASAMAPHPLAAGSTTLR